jgi:hypothetical protein
VDVPSDPDQPLLQCGGDGGRGFEGAEVSAARDGDQFGVRDRRRGRRGDRDRGEGVLVADEHERRHGDVRQQGPVVRAGEEDPLLVDQTVSAGGVHHRPHQGVQLRVVKARRGDVARPHDPVDRTERPRRHHGDRVSMPDPVDAQPGTGQGVEQGQPGHPLRCLSHDLQGDQTAQRQAGQREPLR